MSGLPENHGYSYIKCELFDKQLDRRFMFLLQAFCIYENARYPGQAAQQGVSHWLIRSSLIWKLEVWKRAGGRCVKCGQTDELHFDHILPYAKGGTSITQ